MIVFTKLVGSLFYPLNLALLALLTALLIGHRRPKIARALGVFALAWLWLWSTPWIAERAAWTLERDYPPTTVESLPTVDAIVLLGGLMRPADPPVSPHPDLNGAADRAWHAALLYRVGRAPTIICSGGRAPLSRSLDPECPDVKRLLIDLGVPPDAILVETGSRTTLENAQETARLVAPDARVLLVTSALHMPRALMVYRAVGIDAIPAATDHIHHPERPSTLADALPGAGALAQSTAVWHEWLGGLWYHLSSR